MKANLARMARRRRQCAIGLVLSGVAALSSVACRDKGQDGPSTATSATSVPAVAAHDASPSNVPTGVATTTSDGPSHEDDHQVAIADAGHDGGRKRRRLAGGRSDAGVIEPPATEPAAAGTASAAAPEDTSRRKHGPMGDDQPYGGGSSGSSATPVLKKKPLGEDDPWAKQ
jgi:hypothetical protein